MRILIIVSLLFLPLSAHASGFAVAEQSAVAAGTGGAAVARAGDPSAAWYNPAALADGFGLRAGVGLTLALPSVEAQATDNTITGETDSPLSTPPHLYVSYAANDWATGLSVNVPFASSTTWPSSWSGRFEAIYSRPQFFRLAPFFAYRIGPVSIAAGPHVDIGRLDVHRSLNFIDAEGSIRALLSGAGFGGHASAFWRISDWVAVGLSYKSRTKISLSGDADFTAPQEFSTKAHDQHAQADLTLPDRITFGVNVSLGDFKFLVDTEINLWNVNEKLVIDFEDEETSDSVKKNDWSTTFTVRSGAEWTPLDYLTARLGILYDPSPVPDSTLSPSSPDATRIGLTLGASVKLWDLFFIDAFYEFLYLIPRTATGPDAPVARYEGTAHLFGFGLRFQLPN
jgi:long-chain fatty acid transport protein